MTLRSRPMAMESGSSPEREWIDAREKFNEILSEMMVEHGIDYGRVPKSAMHDVMRECTAKYAECWDELMEWVCYDKAERTRRLIRTGIAASRRRYR